MAGICNREICRRTGLTDSQVTYRLNKAKVNGEYDFSFRHMWRYGNTPLVDKFMDDYQGIMELEIQRKIAVKIDHPTPQTVRVPE